MSGDGEEFLSLEDDEAPVIQVKERKPKKSQKPLLKSTENTSSQSTAVQAELVDMEVLGEYGGNHSVCWPLQDMDCPDC
ncbi:MAG: hypothetical protein VXX17_03150, partial [Candidatus Thermoplasmatota archaeon]|nr:hypothetical protein [Candidatus Thermoplasmatota archaeon]